MIFKILHIYILGLTFCLLSACAKTPVPTAPAPVQTMQEAPPIDKAQALWQRYVDYCNTTNALAKQPYRLQLSLRYGNEGDTRRVTALLWGNGPEHLRLDVSAGVGAMIASIEENGRHFMVYAPREKQAYTHKGARPLLTVGVPVPFGVGDLAALLTGRYEEVFGLTYTGTPKPSPKSAKDTNYIYTITQGRAAGTLEINEQGLPILWTSEAREGWRMEITHTDAQPPQQALPHKIVLHHSKGQRAVILIKEREYPLKPFTEAQMRLTLPAETPVLPLQQFKQTAQIPHATGREP